MKNIVLFGAGFYGKIAINHIGNDRIAYIVDNDPSKENKNLLGITIYDYHKHCDDLQNKLIVVSVREELYNDIINQLEKDGFTNYKTLTQFEQEMVQERATESLNNIAVYQRAVKWIYNHTIESEGIINTTTLYKSYPEVTGYYIPSLLDWGYKDLAKQYAKWLCSIQKTDGSWYNTDDEEAFVFDTGQILKGLIAIYSILPEVKECIIRGCDWLVSNMTEEGRLPAVNPETWGDGKTLSELVHIYCLSPLRDAGKLLERDDYIESANKILKYYIENYKEKILDFHLLSHFYAYVIEGLVDMGQVELAQAAMDKVALLQTENGAVPAYKNGNGICSTGLFQFAIIWFKLGDLQRGQKAFEYACKMQNKSGGWYGSYQPAEGASEKLTYIPDAEISWAVKYFLDALKYQGKLVSKMRCDFFIGEVNTDSSSYQTLKQAILKAQKTKKKLEVLDVGCGKGVQIHQLKKDIHNINICAVDIINETLQCIPKEDAETKLGSLTNIPYANDTFDVTYTCEALEHAVDIPNAVKELTRVTKPGGTIIIIDKYKEALSVYLIEKWEQFFDESKLQDMLELYCDEVEIVHGIGHSEKEAYMSAWIGVKKVK